LTPRNIPPRMASRDLDRTVSRLIAERRAGGADGDDLLSVLIRGDASGKGLTDRQIRDHVMTMIFAGHESTALALSWSWYLLARHPEAGDRLRAELHRTLGGRTPSVDDLTRLRAVGQVVQEAMRLYPPIYAFGRDAVRDVVVGGHLIPAGSSAIIAPWVTHRDPGFFPRPTEFRPERWTEEFERTLPRFAYLPFGGGARMCIGRSFATTQAVLVLATLLQRHSARLVEAGPVELWPTFSLRSRHGLPMVIERCEVARSHAARSPAI
jgi:cytochrome P450